MIYAKSLLAGLVAVAILEMVLMAAATVFAAALLGRGGYWVFDWHSWLDSHLRWPVFVPTLLSFVGSSWWMFKRESKR